MKKMRARILLTAFFLIFGDPEAWMEDFTFSSTTEGEVTVSSNE